MVLSFDEVTNRTDIGAICYLKRRFIHQYNEVILSSLIESRRAPLRRIVGILSQLIRYASNRPKTVRAITRNFIRFVDWCDENGFHDVLENSTLARTAVVHYIAHLREMLRRRTLKCGSAQVYQSGAIQILSELFEFEYFSEGLNLIHAAKNTQVTSMPDEDDLGKSLGLYTAFFRGLSELVADFKPYPYRLAMPKFLGFDGDHLWVFPTNRWYMTPEDQTRRHSLINASMAYDYKNGCIDIIGNISRFFSVGCSANGAIRQATRILNEANENPRHITRLKRGIFACNAFLYLFLANTGMNLAQALELPWHNDYSVGSERQGYKQIKYRSNNKLVSFEVQAVFLKDFKRYVELRKMLVGEVDFGLLFFCLGSNCSSGPARLRGSAINQFHRNMSKIYPALPRITSRGLRAAKADFMINHADPSTAALLLGNSETTLLKHYADGSESTSIEEMSSYFDKLSESVVRLDRNDSSQDEVAIDTELGECSKFDSPASLTVNAPVKPDCKQPEGCLFCDKYMVHADERDTRKLFSCKYVINQTRHLASQESFELHFGLILSRIDQIISQIVSAIGSSEMVDRVRLEVEDEKLDPYWGNKLRLLIEVGIVS